MKKQFLLLSLISLLLLTVSCKNEKIEAISNHEQFFADGVKTDLSFKCKELKKIKDIYVIDSINYCESKLPKSHDSISSYLNILDKYITTCDELLNHYETWDDDYDYWMRNKQETIEQKKFVENYIQYTKEENKLLCTEYVCVYTIKNPLLGGVKQEITKTYYISPNNKIIKTK